MVSAKSAIRLSSQEYVSHIVALPNTLVAALTDSSILSLPIAEMNHSSAKNVDISTVNKRSNTPMAGMQALPSTPMTVVSCSTDGHLKIWDLRTKGGLQQQIEALDSQLTVTALGVSNFGELALGTEAQPDAEIIVYDVRQIKAAKPLVKYTDSHNDDVTDLQFHPSIRNRMVSGSTDGVVNLFDISITDEDEAVLEAYNHQASIHRTGFFTDSHEAVKRLRLDDDKPQSQDRVFALSHMETLTVYPVDALGGSDGELGEVGTDTASTGKQQDFGDVRDAWQCQYVADYNNQHFMIGSNDEQWAALVPILDGTPQERILLEEGHGEEVVRCFDFWPASGACFTGGEDGIVKLWDITGQFDEAAERTAQLTEAENAKQSLTKERSRKHVLKRANPLDRSQGSGKKNKHGRGAPAI